MARWPKDNQTALKNFYGDPGDGEVSPQLIKITPPFKMYYDGRLLKTLTFHRKAAPALLASLNKVWDYYDHDQTVIDELGVSKTAGTYNHRKVRGSATKWSNHAFGAAIDINAEENGFNVEGNIPRPVIAAFKSEGFAWGGDYSGRPDPMHFEACDRGEPALNFEQWLKKFGVPPKNRPIDVAEASSSVPLDDFAEPEVSAARRSPSPTVAVGVATAGSATMQDMGGGDPVIKLIQLRLKAMGHDPGGIDGKWGDRTLGAIAGFIGNRGLSIAAPTTLDQFRLVADKLSAELGRAESEGYARPIAPERAQATESIVAEKVPEIVPVRRGKFAAFWAAVVAAFGSVVSKLTDSFQDAMSWFATVKTYLAGVPGWVWFATAAGGLLYFAFLAQRGASGITKSFNDGTRS